MGNLSPKQAHSNRPMKPTLLTEPAEFQAWCLSQKREGKRIGLVPTMGALHDGHLSLIDACAPHCDLKTVSIFVNPSQFGPQEDYEKYPRALDSDLEKLTLRNVDVVFAPETSAMYPDGCTTLVQPPAIASVLEGAMRPGHFQGVVTVVLKLLNLSLADVAVFGQKDYQQLAVIRQMVADLNVATRIIGAPIVREADGLAMSSRNRYLSAEERPAALALSQSLQEVTELFQSGCRDGRELAASLMQVLIDGGVDTADYAVIADAQSLEIVDTITQPAVALVAAHVGQTRLIDNCLLQS